ncbi:MAG: pyridoxamine 5'-phosphate oxidase family protein [Clostridia bacterium]|nr:pyridoxamine 5'-phosphate oxidase family protein [Clostridia bacterium]
MTNIEKISNFLTEAKVFHVLTTDGDQPKGRPFGMHVVVNDRIYFGCGTFKNVYKQLTANPKVEILALKGGEFLRYDGIATVDKSEEVLAKIRETAPQIMEMYDKNGWEMGVFYLANGHAEFRQMMTTVDEFDV